MKCPDRPKTESLSSIRRIAREAGFPRSKTKKSLPDSSAKCPETGPCPYVSCRHHLFLDVNAAGGIQYNFPEGIGPTDLISPCALRFANQGEHTLEGVGSLLGGVSRERVRQIEAAALGVLRSASGWEDYWPDGRDVEHMPEGHSTANEMSGITLPFKLNCFKRAS